MRGKAYTLTTEIGTAKPCNDMACLRHIPGRCSDGNISIGFRLTAQMTVQSKRVLNRKVCGCQTGLGRGPHFSPDMKVTGRYCVSLNMWSSRGRCEHNTIKVPCHKIAHRGRHGLSSWGARSNEIQSTSPGSFTSGFVGLYDAEHGDQVPVLLQTDKVPFGKPNAMPRRQECGIFPGF